VRLPGKHALSLCDSFGNQTRLNTMSFFTSLTYYRPCTPPIVTGNDLANLITQLYETGTLTDSGFQILQVKFGNSVDQDEQDSSSAEEIMPGLAVMDDIEWDLDVPKPSGIRGIIDALKGDNRPVYRAYASLGGAIDAVLKPITRTKSPENQINFCPDSVSLEIGPIEIFNLRSDAPAFVGWIGLSLSGNGYLFPWKFRDVFERLESTPEVQRIAEACRSFWPVAPDRPEPCIVELRRQLDDLWPYDSFDKEWDWYWGIQETG